jgi:hypothetical protein
MMGLIIREEEYALMKPSERHISLGRSRRDEGEGYGEITRIPREVVYKGKR